MHATGTRESSDPAASTSDLSSRDNAAGRSAPETSAQGLRTLTFGVAAAPVDPAVGGIWVLTTAAAVTTALDIMSGLRVPGAWVGLALLLASGALHHLGSGRRGLGLVVLGLASSASALFIGFRTYELVAAALAADAPGLVARHWHTATIQGLMVVLVVAFSSLEKPRAVLLAIPLVAVPLVAGAAAGTPTLSAGGAARTALGLAAAVLGAAGMIRLVRVSRRGSLPQGQLGRYVLDEEVGTGGMGVVYRAHHRDLDRRAAVKIVRPRPLPDSAGGSSAVERFEREAVATANLHSPHTVELYDYGEAGDGTLYYVMEYLEGVDVQRLVEHFGPQPPARVIHILLQVCESLEEAHRASLVHRDVKPSNILLSRLASASDFVKVLDFGLARPSRARGTDDVTSGTPAYMAPEVAIGDDAVDGRSDIYSLGCVAYWLLTGSPVFESEDPAEVLASHVDEEPVPPSCRSEIDVPPDLERIVSRCLAKAPDDRFASVEALREALQECDLAGAWSAEDAQEWWELHFPEAGVPDDLARMLE